MIICQLWVNQWVIHPRLLQLLLAHLRWLWLYGLPLPSHTFCLSWLSPAHSHNQESQGGHFYSKELSDQERVSLRKSGLGWPESIWTKRHSQDKHLQIEDIMSTKVTWSPPLSQFSLPLSSPLTVRLDPSAICTPWMYTTPSNCCYYPYICLWIKQTRPSILCVTHQISRKMRNYSVGWTVPWDNELQVVLDGTGSVIQYMTMLAGTWSV